MATQGVNIEAIVTNTANTATSAGVIDDAVIVDDAAFTPATTRVMMAGYEFDDTTPDSVNEGDAGAARMTANRAQHMVIRDNAGNERGANVNSSSELTVVDGSVLTDDAAFTPATSRVQPTGFFADETATDSVDEGDIGAGRMTLDRKQIVTDYAHTAGGATPYSALSTAAVLAAEIKASAGQVYGIQAFNNGANEVFARVYNQTGSPGTGDAANIVWRGVIPGNAAGAGFAVQFTKGLACGTGIGIRVSGAVADNDNTNLAANEVQFNLQYK